MMFTKDQIDTYLKKIGFEGKVTHTLECLTKIVEGHIFTVPYECMAIHDSKFDDGRNRTPINRDALFKKCVEDHRGGHCVEINVLLQNMLIGLGFEVMPIAAEVVFKHAHEPVGQRPNHCVAVVKINDQSYLIDAGFGGYGLLSPIQLKQNEYIQYSEKFKLKEHTHYRYELQCWQHNEWISLYGFSTIRATSKEYQKINLINENPLNERSWFTDYFLCTKPFKIDEQTNGRYRICNGDFYIFENKKIVYQEKLNDETMRSRLKENFNIILPSSYHRSTPVYMKLFELYQVNPIRHGYNTRYSKHVAELVNQTQRYLEDMENKEPESVVQRRNIR